MRFKGLLNATFERQDKKEKEIKKVEIHVSLHSYFVREVSSIFVQELALKLWRILLAYLKLNFNINSGFGNRRDKSGPQKKEKKE